MQTVKLLGICGSPRKSGNSRFLLERALACAQASLGDTLGVELYSFAGKEIAPCNSCFRCSDLGDCAIKDDFQELRDKWVSADAILYSVPVYHMGVPGQVKCFIDRLGNGLEGQGDNVSKDLKTVGVIAQGADIFAGQEQVMTYLVNHAVCMSCLPVAGDPFQSYIGAAGWTCSSVEKDSLERLHSDGERCADSGGSRGESGKACGPDSSLGEVWWSGLFGDACGGRQLWAVPGTSGVVMVMPHEWADR